MQVNKCDRCEAIFDGMKVGGRMTPPKTFEKSYYELCPECVKSLEQWLSKGVAYVHDNRPQS